MFLIFLPLEFPLEVFRVVSPEAYQRIDEVSAQVFALAEELKQVRLSKYMAGVLQLTFYWVVCACAVGEIGTCEGRCGRDQSVEVVRSPRYPSCSVTSTVAFLSHIPLHHRDHARMEGSKEKDDSKQSRTTSHLNIYML